MSFHPPRPLSLVAHAVSPLGQVKLHPPHSRRTSTYLNVGASGPRHLVAAVSRDAVYPSLCRLQIATRRQLFHGATTLEIDGMYTYMALCCHCPQPRLRRPCGLCPSPPTNPAHGRQIHLEIPVGYGYGTYRLDPHAAPICVPRYVPGRPFPAAIMLENVLLPASD